MKKILIACTGSVAAVKIPILYEQLAKTHQVKIVATQNALKFMPSDFATIYTDQNEPDYKISDTILHIELSKWADILIIAPLGANTLAKIANGICDNLLTCVIRAWDWNKTTILAPSMNTQMWNHPLSIKQIETIISFSSNPTNVIYLEPICKVLACGEYGIGAMAQVDTIIHAVTKNE
jgi:phosphopantothenoylcysteine decarboxylase